MGSKLHADLNHLKGDDSHQGWVSSLLEVRCKAPPNTDKVRMGLYQINAFSFTFNDTSREINLYQDLVVYNEEKIGALMTQMEQWSILSNVLNYVQHSRLHSMNHTLDIKAVDKYKYRHNTDNREFKELDFDRTPQKLQEEYMDIYEGVHSEIVSSSKFDENSDISTTYLGKVDKENQHKLKAEESFSYLRTWLHRR